MTILWNEKSASEATGGKGQGGAWQASRVEIDSRRVQPGDLFVAIKGERFDGHDYVADAFSKGAVAAIVSKDISVSNPSLLVEDTLKALEGLARFSRAASRAKIIGVTGSVGKTSAKEMIKLALAAHGKTYATTGNFNNHIGTPLGLANLPPDAAFGVFEMGMNHAGEIAHLTRMVRPDIAVITNIEAVHMEFFPSLDAIADAKAEIFEGMQKGIAILNRDNAFFDRLKKAAGQNDCVSVGESKNAQVRLLAYQPSATGCELSASIYGNRVQYRLGAVGKHWALASLLALAASQALKLDNDVSAAALAAFSEPEGRGRALPIAVTGGQALLIDDSYNASPASMRGAFAKTDELWQARGKKGRKIAALGDMLELGPQAPELHAALTKDLQQSGFDAVFTAGDLMRHLHDALPPAMQREHTKTPQEWLPLLRKSLKPEDILLIKGSHGSKTYEVAKILEKK